MLLDGPQCGFSYRDSVFKRSTRYVVLAVAFALEQSRLGAPVRYAELAGRLGVEVGDRVPAADVRAAVLELRRGKGMVLDAGDHDTWSAGSFFTNPLLTRRRGSAAARGGARAGRPRRPGEDLGGVADRAGRLREGLRDRARPGSPTKHTLALTNRGGATTADLLALAREIRSGVLDRFGVALGNEPDLVGVEL